MEGLEVVVIGVVEHGRWECRKMCGYLGTV
jgi:hypothetical protein